MSCNVLSLPLCSVSSLFKMKYYHLRLNNQNTQSYLRRMPVPHSLGLIGFHWVSLILKRNRLEPCMLPAQHQNVYHPVYFIWCNIPTKFQQHCFIIGGDILNFLSHHCTCTNLRSKRFRGAKSEEWGFRCFARAKNGARAKIRRRDEGYTCTTDDVISG